MNTKRKKTGRKLLSFLLTLAMVVGLMPGMSLTAYAEDTVYYDLKYKDDSGAYVSLVEYQLLKYLNVNSSALKNIIDKDSYGLKITDIAITNGAEIATVKEEYSGKYVSFSNEGSAEVSVTYKKNTNSDPETKNISFNVEKSPVQSFQFDGYGALSLPLGMTHRLKYIITTSSDDVDKTIEWTPPTEGIATVSADGVITPVKVGNSGLGIKGIPKSSSQNNLIKYLKLCVTEAIDESSDLYMITFTNGYGFFIGVKYTALPCTVPVDEWGLLGGLIVDSYGEATIASEYSDYISLDTSTGALTINKPFDASMEVTNIGQYHNTLKLLSCKKITIHNHSFTYKADGATITATCGEGCDITDGLTLTISVPTGTMTYDGTTTFPATLSTGYNTTAFPGPYTITYTKDGSAFDGTPTDAGAYVASVTVGEGDGAATASVSYTINKADSTAATVTANNRTYDGTEKPLVTETGTATGGEMQYTLGMDDKTAPTTGYTTSIPTATEAGTYYVWYKVIGDSNHNDSEAACIEVSISKKVINVTADAKSITYGEKDVELTYSVKGLAGSETVDKILTGALEREIGTDAGTYKITQGTLKASDNYTVTFTGADYVIKKAAKTAVTEKFTSTKATDSTTSDAKISGFDKAKAYQYSSDAGKTWTDMTGKTEIDAKAGTYQIRYAGDKNHEPSAAVDVIVSAKASQDKPTGLDITYVSKEGATDGAVTGVNDTMEYSIDGGKTWTAVAKDAVKIENLAAGKVLVRIKGTDDKNPSEAVEVTVSVKKTDVDNLAINAGFKVTQKGSKITVKWGKVNGATGYEVYVQYCGKDFSKIPAKRTTTKTSSVVTKIGGKKINLKKNFKVYVVAVKKDGSKTAQLAKTITGHIVGRKNTKYTNVKSINLTTKTVSVEVGKTSTIKAKTVLVNKKKKQLSDAHASEFRYASSDKSIATVDKNGKVTGVAKGTCTIYVYARNGYAKTVRVTVK